MKHSLHVYSIIYNIKQHVFTLLDLILWRSTHSLNSHNRHLYLAHTMSSLFNFSFWVYLYSLNIYILHCFIAIFYAKKKKPGQIFVDKWDEWSWWDAQPQKDKNWDFPSLNPICSHLEFLKFHRTIMFSQ